MVSEEKQYEFVTATISARIQGAIDAFKLFLQLFSAIVGGAVWLSLQPSATKARYAPISDALVILVTFVCFVLVAESLRGWYGYRKAQCELVGKDEAGNYRVPLPTKFPAPLAESTMMLAMLVACVVFMIFNPFSIAH